MDAKNLAAALRLIMGGYQTLEESIEEGDLSGLAAVKSFAEAGIMSRDEGLVLTCDDGSQYQISVVQSRARTRVVALCPGCGEETEIDRHTGACEECSEEAYDRANG